MSKSVAYIEGYLKYSQLSREDLAQSLRWIVVTHCQYDYEAYHDWIEGFSDAEADKWGVRRAI
jgi:hypothetical protein